jgi:hypothetical protein
MAFDWLSYVEIRGGALDGTDERQVPPLARLPGDVVILGDGIVGESLRRKWIGEDILREDGLKSRQHTLGTAGERELNEDRAVLALGHERQPITLRRNRPMQIG